jgi:preprotein translocase subunit SecG
MNSRKANVLRQVAIVLPIAFVLTFLGLTYSWQQVEAPDSMNSILSVVLLLPIAGLSIFFRKISSDGHLSALTYRIVLVVGALGQFLYYYAVIAVIRWSALRLKTTFRASGRGNK